MTTCGRCSERQGGEDIFMEKGVTLIFELKGGISTVYSIVSVHCPEAEFMNVQFKVSENNLESFQT